MHLQPTTCLCRLFGDRRQRGTATFLNLTVRMKLWFNRSISQGTRAF